MDLGAAGLHEQPFRTHGRPPVVVSYAARRDAHKTLEEACDHVKGLCLLQGPTLSGKSTIIRAFVDQFPKDRAIAVVNGEGLNTTGLLEAVLRQFGYQLDHSSANELLAMLRVFAMQQTAAHEAPVLVIENAHALNPSALRALCELADLKIRGACALRMVLVSDRSLKPVLEVPAAARINSRVTHDFHLRPMGSAETREYVHAKLRAAGSDKPDFIFSRSICNELWRASGGWPGILDRIALLAIAKAETLPVTADVIERPTLPTGTWLEGGPSDLGADGVPGVTAPRLYVTLNGQTLQDIVVEQPRLLIGRTEHNDIAIASQFVSRHHALLVRHGSTTFLMDLNSTNGTFVNSRRVSNHVLLDNDIISLGHHRIKFCDPHATRRAAVQTMDFAETAIMKTLDDMRRLLAQENTEVLPSLTENLPTAGLQP